MRVRSSIGRAGDSVMVGFPGRTRALGNTVEGRIENRLYSRYVKALRDGKNQSSKRERLKSLFFGKGTKTSEST